MIKKPTITVGIPAHNEQNTITDLILSILKQKGDFILKRVLVVCDGCTDLTEKNINKIKDSRIKVFNDNKKLGKVQRLNQIYKGAQTDYLITLDADVLLVTNNEIQNMLKVMRQNKKAKVVAGNIVLSSFNTGFVPKILQINHELWSVTTQAYKNGKNIHTSHGACYMLKKSFYKKYTFPKGVTCDQGFLYLFAKPNGYYFAHKTNILCNPLQNFKEIQIGYSRTTNEKSDLTKHFGNRILKEYTIPLKYRLYGLLRMFYKSPIYTALSVLFNIWLKVFTVKDEGLANGYWTVAKTSKHKVLNI